MRLRPTPLALALIGTLAWTLLLALLTARVELAAVAAPLLLALLLPEGQQPRWHLDYTVSRGAVYEGDTVTVTVTLEADDALPLIELTDRLPLGSRPVEGSVAARLCSLHAGGQRRWSYRLRLDARGCQPLGRLRLRVWTDAGLHGDASTWEQPQTVWVYPQPLTLSRVPAPARTRSTFGDHLATQTGSGLEPAEVGPYARGDSIRRINWRASLRRNQLHVTRFHTERNADIVLLLDTFASVGVAPAASLDQCVRACAGLASAYLARRDRVGLIEYGGYTNWLPPAQGPQQQRRLQAALVQSDVYFSYTRRSLGQVPPRVLAAHALVIAVSALVDARFVDALLDLRQRRFDLLLLALEPTKLLRAALPGGAVQATAVDLWALEWQARLADLRRRGVIALRWASDEPLPAALARCPTQPLRRRLLTM